MSTRLDLSKLSLMDALDLAKLIELEACHRYQMFANQFGHSSGNDAGAFFSMMARNEAKHGQELEERRAKLFGDAPAKLTLDDVNRVIRENLDTSNMQYVFVTRDGDGLRERLLSDERSPMTYDADLPQEVLDEDLLIDNIELGIESADVVPADEVFN